MKKSKETNWLEAIKKFSISHRNLPHWQQPDSIYFITTNCKIQKSDQKPLLSEEEKDIVLNSIIYFDDKRYKLYAAVVMPDHFHIIIQPITKEKDAYYSISEIMHSIKSYTSHKINIIRRSNIPLDQNKSKKKDLYPTGRKYNQIWQHESYDRIIRDEKEFIEKINYVINNPVKKRICDNPENYKWLYFNLDKYGS